MEDRQSKKSEQTAYEVIAPTEQRVPLVFASPHSGCFYPTDFVAASRLDRLTLRRSEDSYVDEIFKGVALRGAPLLRALFPRAYVDANREPFELDPAMFHEALPSYANSTSPRVVAGLGTIARIVANGADIYRQRLSLDEALSRIDQCYWPYHRALGGLIETTKERFGFCILIDCHSMPSVGGPLGQASWSSPVDCVLGDCHGSACAPEVTARVERRISSFGYRVVRNSPYSGGFVTRHYGRPGDGVHALQIELNRALYMDEEKIEAKPKLANLADHMAELVDSLAALDLAAPPLPSAAE